MKVIDSIWFNTPQGHFGFVVGENERGERKLYGGVVTGLDQKYDEKLILDYGNKISTDMLESIIARTKQKGD